MKNSLSDIYEQILLNEAEKHALQNPTSDEVGNLKTKNDLFGSKPKPVEGPDKAKLAKGPSYKETTGVSSSKSSETTKSSAPMKSAPTKNPTTEKPKEMKDTDVDPTNEEEKEDKKKKHEETKKESFALSSFEALFKKALIEENEEEGEEKEEGEEGSLKEEAMEGEEELETPAEEHEEHEEEEGDLISDLKELQTKLSDILAKLEDSSEEEGEEESEEYSENDFDDEFGNTEAENEETAMKESVDKPKALSPAKGKMLMSKKNKIGKVTPKGGKAHTGSVDDAPEPKPLGDKKGTLQKGKPVVKSSITKGDFIK